MNMDEDTQRQHQQAQDAVVAAAAAAAAQLDLDALGHDPSLQETQHGHYLDENSLPLSGAHDQYQLQQPDFSRKDDHQHLHHQQHQHTNLHAYGGENGTDDLGVELTGGSDGDQGLGDDVDLGNDTQDLEMSLGMGQSPGERRNAGFGRPPSIRKGRSWLVILYIAGSVLTDAACDLCHSAKQVSRLLSGFILADPTRRRIHRAYDIPTSHQFRLFHLADTPFPSPCLRGRQY